LDRSVHIEPVDERDGSWEDDHPRFRVYLFESGERIIQGAPTSWTVSTYDIDGADVLEVIRWAQSQVADDGLYAVALVGERESQAPQHRRGLSWLVGRDANDTPEDWAERRTYERMKTRRGRTIVQPESPRFWITAGESRDRHTSAFAAECAVPPRDEDGLLLPHPFPNPGPMN
jgi:hypothetical protein